MPFRPHKTYIPHWLLGTDLQPMKVKSTCLEAKLIETESKTEVFNGELRF